MAPTPTTTRRRVFTTLDGAGLIMIEQPYALGDSSPTPGCRAGSARRCLDESVVDIHDLHTMLALEAGRVLNIKISRMEV